MDRLRCADLTEATGGELRTVDPSTEISGNAIDSRKVAPGDIFWALAGERTDGHLFADDAISRGSKLVVCRADRAEAIEGPRLVVPDPLIALQQFSSWYRSQQSALVIGVTGSVGKTTTRGLIHSVLSAQFDGVQSPASFNNHLGLPLSLLDIEQQHEFAVLELGASHVGEITALTDIARPEVGVITAIGRAHLAGFGSVDNIIRGKGELLEALPASGFAVLPGDDPVTRTMAALAPCRVLFVGEDENNTIRHRSPPSGERTDCTRARAGNRDVGGSNPIWIFTLSDIPRALSRHNHRAVANH
jgi:UDP-N-acetylmuramoyl-tripeptide--D-alanyl-D-alanine ligase